MKKEEKEFRIFFDSVFTASVIAFVVNRLLNEYIKERNTNTSFETTIGKISL